MAFVIPKDPQVMANKGALFIVADGMGGHAAGEVASEIAVDTVSNMYYQEDGNDVAVSLLRAIRRANASIHQRAAEQVRAGLLTEEQARTHAQRNVIPRCLGTQAEVDVDVFHEELYAGDSLVLCTDGLSGLVSDEELM